MHSAQKCELEAKSKEEWLISKGMHSAQKCELEVKRQFVVLYLSDAFRAEV